jgi:hypothetical protein
VEYSSTTPVVHIGQCSRVLAAWQGHNTEKATGSATCRRNVAAYRNQLLQTAASSGCNGGNQVLQTVATNCCNGGNYVLRRSEE